jgi:hypothetical protein
MDLGISASQKGTFQKGTVGVRIGKPAPAQFRCELVVLPAPGIEYEVSRSGLLFSMEMPRAARRTLGGVSCRRRKGAQPTIQIGVPGSRDVGRPQPADFRSERDRAGERRQSSAKHGP